jgi:DNA-binding MarR family transcriptional regulator
VSEVNEPLGLIDLISEKHLELRQKLHEMNGQDLNKTEAHILTILKRQGPQPIPEVSRLINISRQGVHKCVQGLLAGQFVEAFQVEGNLRDKHIVLTAKGDAYCTSMEATKTLLEQQIAERIGQERVDLLKGLLKDDWFTGH